MGGRGLPVPPLVPIVAVVALLAGVSIGYGLAPKVEPAAATIAPNPTGTPTQTPVSVPSGYITDWSMPGDSTHVYVYQIDGDGTVLLPSETLPPKGVSLAVAAANKTAPVDLASVVAAKVEPYYMVNPTASSNIWVWAIEVKLPNPAVCRAPVLGTLSPVEGPVTVPQASDVDSCAVEYQTVIVDYKTGIWLETIAGSTP